VDTPIPRLTSSALLVSGRSHSSNSHQPTLLERDSSNSQSLSETSATHVLIPHHQIHDSSSNSGGSWSRVHRSQFRRKSCSTCSDDDSSPTSLVRKMRHACVLVSEASSLWWLCVLLPKSAHPHICTNTNTSAAGPTSTPTLWCLEICAVRGWAKQRV
jgi:hypothetical protein